MFADKAWDLAGALARQWFRDQCAAPFEPFHVFYRPSDGAQPGDVIIARAVPGPEYRQAGGRPVSGSWSIEQARAHLYAIIEPLPILPTAPAEPTAGRRGAAKGRRRP